MASKTENKNVENQNAEGNSSSILDKVNAAVSRYHLMGEWEAEDGTTGIYPENIFTRVDLERVTGLSNSTVSAIIKDYSVPVLSLPSLGSRRKMDFIARDEFLKALTAHINSGGAKNVGGAIDRLMVATDEQVATLLRHAEGNDNLKWLLEPNQLETRLEREKRSKAINAAKRANQNGNGKAEAVSAEA